MPKKLNWNFVSKLKFQNVNEFKDWYMDLNAIVKHNNLVTCNCCISHNKQHKMKEIRLACNSEACYNTGQACDFKYKVLHCSKQHDKYFIYQHGEHAGVAVAKEKKRGIKNYVKRMIKECMKKTSACQLKFK